MDFLEFLNAIEDKMIDGWSAFKNAWSSYSTFFARFNITGLSRLLNEFLSEALTLGTAGICLMMVLALPAFELAEEDWRAKGQYSVTFLDRYGNEIGQRGIRHNDSVPLAEIPDYMIKAAMATEDRRFFDHYGIDPLGLIRAIVTNMRAGGVVQGGSTLTQQLAKNLFLSSERSFQRKINEAFLSLWLETHMTKKEILTEYFNRAYMGGGAYGLEAAAQFYFNKSIRNVTLAEAAMLAGLFKAPTQYAPHKNLPAARERTLEVLNNLVEAGFMTEGQVHEAKLHPAKAVVRPETYSPGYFLDWAFEETKRITKGKGEFVLTVKTTVDLDLQRDAERIITRVLRQKGRRYRATQAALVGMEAHTGAVRAIVGGRDYESSQFNRATNGKRQPGSSIKPYVYFSAIKELGYTPNTRVLDSSSVRCGRWSPRNFGGRYRGRIPMWFALQKSINTVAVYLANKVGRKKIVANMAKMGLKGVRPNCTMPIGTESVRLIKHVSGYATFATGGLRVPDYVIEEIRNSYGELIYSHDKDAPKIHRIFKEKHTAYMVQMMARVVKPGGTAPRADLNFTTVAGKTGTTNRSRDAWFMGFTGKYVAGVWFGNDNYKPMAHNSFGGTLPAEVWHDFMVAAHKDPNIPRIPGLPIHPNQKGYMSALQASRLKDPAIGRAAQLGRGLPDGTRQALKTLISTMQNASAIDPKNIIRNRASLTQN